MTIDAASRLRNNASLLGALVDVSERFLTEAEKLQKEDVARCVIFIGPMWLHGTAMCDTLRPRGKDLVMWNLPALAVLARTMMECFIGLAHVCESVDGNQRQLRRLLWERQACYKVADILKGGVKLNPEYATVAEDLRKRVDEIQVLIESSAALKSLESNMRGRVINNPETFLTSSQEAIWVRSGLPGEDFWYLRRTLSQWAHLTPLAIHIQSEFAENNQLVGYCNSAVKAASTVLTKGLQFATKFAPELSGLYDEASQAMAKFQD